MSAIKDDHLTLDCTLTLRRSQLERPLLPGLSVVSEGSPMTRSLFPTEGSTALKIWTPEELDPHEADGAQESEGAHRILTPVCPPSALFEQIAAEHQSGPQRLSPSEVTRVRETLTLPEFYAEFMKPWRESLPESKGASRGTLQKERQAINRWQKWELANPPEKWPKKKRWTGLPIGFITSGYWDRCLDSLLGSYAFDTVTSTRDHLRTVFNHAVKIGVLARCPQPLPLEKRETDEDGEEDLARVWSEEELAVIIPALAHRPELLTAFVTGCLVGPRSVDLFQLRWSRHVKHEESPPRVRYRAKKTGKWHGFPLHPIVQAQLERLRREHLFEPGGPVFPTLTSTHSADPEKSKPARRRNAAIKKILRNVGIDPPVKPWQVCRATCCTLFNSVEPGLGSWMIGQGKQNERAGTKLAADFYDNPTADYSRAILSAGAPKVPPAFLALL